MDTEKEKVELVKYVHPWIKLCGTFINLDTVKVIDFDPKLSSYESEAIVFYFIDDGERQRFFDDIETEKDECEIPQIKEEIENILLEN